MAGWAKQHLSNRHAQRPDNYRPGIHLHLLDLLDMRRQPLLNWQTPRAKVKSHRVGGFISRFRGRGMDFDESRLYQIGDDIRNIDWRVTARTGKAHTKIFREERERPVFVILDQMPSMFFASKKQFKAVLAAKICAQLMWQALAHGDRFGCLVFSAADHMEMKPASNRRSCMRLLQRIVDNHQLMVDKIYGAHSITQHSNNESPLAQTLKRLSFLAKPGSLVHIVSDFRLFDDTVKRRLSRISQHVDLHGIRITDVLDENLPPPGEYAISDGRDITSLDIGSDEQRQNYHRQQRQLSDNLQSFFLSHRGVYSEINTQGKQMFWGAGAAVSSLAEATAK